MIGERRTAVLSVGLLVVGLALLTVGGFVQFNDTSGFGSNKWNLPLGAVAVVTAIVAVLVASTDATARLWLGVALGVLVAFLLWQSLVNRGLRFVWHHDEGELAILEIVLGLIASVLIATGLQPSPRTGTAAATTAGATSGSQGAGRWLVRGSLYLCGSAALMGAAIVAGMLYYDANYCGAGGDSECLAVLGGLLWGAASLLVSGVVVVIIEIVLWRRRRRRNRQPQGR